MDPATIIAVSELSVKILSLISQYYSDVKHAKRDIERLESEIQSLHAVFKKVQELIQKSSLAPKFQTSASLIRTTEQALIDVTGLERQLEHEIGAKPMSRVGKSALKWPFAKKEVNEWVAKLERHKTSLDLALTTDQSWQIHDIDTNVAQLGLGRKAEEQDRLLGKLRVADDAIFNSYHRQHESQCTASTRVELLQQLEDWGAKHQRPIFWLSGMAGTGKSTIARTLAGKMNERNTLGGSFFFSRASGSSKNAANFVGTLAYELANKSPHFKDRVCEAISSNGDVLRQGLRNQWEELIIGPLSKPKLLPRHTINFVIDALDECGSEDDIRLILQLLVEVKDLSAIDLGVFVTSRPQLAIRLGFEKMPEIIHQNLDLRDIPRQTIEHDIALFLRQEFSRISQEHKLPDWPNQDHIQALVQRADGLFIYAATVCGFVGDEDWNPQERLSEILRGGSAEVGGTVQLDEMYSEVLRCALTKDRREGDAVKLCDRFRNVVGSIVTLSDTISVSALANLLNISVKNVGLALGNLHSVLDIPSDPETPIRLLHPSFHDFVTDEDRCEDLRFSVDKLSIHSELLMRCLEVMFAVLRRNVCNLKTLGSSLHEVQKETMSRHLPSHAQYACQYWAEHLGSSRSEQWRLLGLRDGGIIHEIFQRYYLYWLEAMSLSGKMSDAVLMVAKVGGMLKNDENPALYALVADANRFNLRNRVILEEAPLQVYAAALVFCPKESLIRKCYQEQHPPWLIRISSDEHEWGPVLQILEGHTDYVSVVGFSPDGKYLASASIDKTVRLWNPKTGALRSTLTGHSDVVSALAFSDSCQLATVSLDEIIRMWDPVSGATQHFLDLKTLSLQRKCLESFRIKFTPNGTLLMGSKDGELRRWDPKTDALTTVNFSRVAVDPLAFSSEGDLLFSKGKGRDGATLSYDTNTGETCHIFSAQTICSALSSDNQIALASSEGKIALCDTAKESLGKLGMNREWHEILDAKRVTALAFSPDNNFLVAGCQSILADLSWGISVRSWDLSTKTESFIGTLVSDVEKVAFSPDGRQLAFNCKYDNAVHVWDPSTKSAHKVREGQPRSFECPVFSYDGKNLASFAVGARGIRIWDPVSGKLRQTLTCDSEIVNEAIFSPDSQQIASGSKDGVVRLWDPVRGMLQHILEYDLPSGIPKGERAPRIFVYANDGKELACIYGDGAVRMWNPANGDLIQKLEGHSTKVETVAFSPNGQVLASCSGDGTIIIWNRAIGKPLHKLETDNVGVFGLGFSPDGQYLASPSRKGVSIWDYMKGDLWKEFESRVVGQSTIAFAPDSQLLALSHEYGVVEIWHPTTETHLETFNIQQGARSLSFSADGTYLKTECGELSSSGFRWSIIGSWLMQGSRKMLWLPPDFRPKRSAYRDGIFALGRETGEIFFLEVDLNYRPPE